MRNGQVDRSNGSIRERSVTSGNGIDKDVHCVLTGVEEIQKRSNSILIF